MPGIRILFYKNFAILPSHCGDLGWIPEQNNGTCDEGSNCMAYFCLGDIWLLLAILYPQLCMKSDDKITRLICVVSCGNFNKGIN